MRNLLAHDYGSANIEIVWQTIINDLPVLQGFCEPFAQKYQLAGEEIPEEENKGFIQTM